jgi:hypothetical protein
MRPISRYRHLMSSTVTVEARTGVDGFGKPTYGAGTSYRCHISRRKRLIRNERGEEIVSGQALYLDAAPDVALTALLTLSASDSSLVHPVLVAVERRFDNAGPHHTVLYLGDVYGV